MLIAKRRNYRPLGQNHHNSKLSNADVLKIREEIKVPDTSIAWLADQYRVSRTTISNLLSGRTYRSVL
jgi:hypothetical protein